MKVLKQGPRRREREAGVAPRLFFYTLMHHSLVGVSRNRIGAAPCANPRIRRKTGTAANGAVRTRIGR